MSKRTALLIASAVALAMQVAFITGYAMVANGCFCAGVSSGGAMRSAPLILGFLDGTDFANRFGIGGQIGDLPSTLLNAALNFALWTAVLFVALNGIPHILPRRFSRRMKV